MNHKILQINQLSVSIDQKKILKSITTNVKENAVTALIGASGSGKSTLLRSLNRMNELTPKLKSSGSIFYRAKNILKLDVVQLRKEVGMLFQKATPFHKSIRENILWATKIHQIQKDPDEIVEEALKKAALWNEVKDRLQDSALKLSGGQQQRLCIARAIALHPSVLLMDEPCSALDPKSTALIEELIVDLKKHYTVLLVTHNLKQAQKVSDHCIFLADGEIIEENATQELFSNPSNRLTKNYLSSE